MAARIDMGSRQRVKDQEPFHNLLRRTIAAATYLEWADGRGAALKSDPDHLMVKGFFIVSRVSGPAARPPLDAKEGTHHERI